MTNWMTKGILNSINTKHAPYKTLIQTSPTNEDVHTRLKTEYTEYRAKLRKSIREAMRLYYLRLFLIHKNGIQKTMIVIIIIIINLLFQTIVHMDIKKYIKHIL